LGTGLDVGTLEAVDGLGFSVFFISLVCDEELCMNLFTLGCLLITELVRTFFIVEDVDVVLIGCAAIAYLIFFSFLF
jgi:hypothetical protein